MIFRNVLLVFVCDNDMIIVYFLHSIMKYTKDDDLNNLLYFYFLIYDHINWEPSWFIRRMAASHLSRRVGLFSA